MSFSGSTHIAHDLLLQFDEAMNKALEKEVTTKTTFKGHLDSYRFCDQVSVPLPTLRFLLHEPGAFCRG